MEFDLNDFSREVHAVSVAHGWHDPEPTPAETIALIHSEWSEALQAYRNGADMHEIATELIDGCLRILDLFGAKGFTCEYDATWFPYDTSGNITIPQFVTILHAATANTCYSDEDFIIEECQLNGLDTLSYVVAGVFNWLSKKGIDPYQVMKEKHEYNKTRPYRHGGKKL